MDELTIDGAQGEGGGQVLRTSLALALTTGRPVRFVRIRARRSKPGLRAQHLACVRAAAAVGCAEVSGAELGSQELTFRPQALAPGDHTVDVGTAGSTGLVLQTVLPALLRASAPSTLRLRGGTHNPLAPPFEFLRRCYFPLVERVGGRVTGELGRPGFFPQGGGAATYRITPAATLAPFELLERGGRRAAGAEALISRLPRHVAERELEVVRRELGWRGEVRELGAAGPGNALLLWAEYEHVALVVASFGERGLPAERVARRAVQDVRRYEESTAPVGPHLADQLVLLLALAGGGAFRATELTGHTRTQMTVIPRFLPVRISSREVAGGHEVAVAG